MMFLHFDGMFIYKAKKNLSYLWEKRDSKYDKVGIVFKRFFLFSYSILRNDENWKSANKHERDGRLKD